MSQRLYGWDIDGMRKEDLIYYNECWLNDLATETKAPYVDMFHNDLTTSMPVCYIAAAGLDPLRDDSELLHRDSRHQRRAQPARSVRRRAACIRSLLPNAR